MKSWKFLDADGADTGRRLFCPTREMADANCGAGERAVEFDATASGPDDGTPARDVAVRRIRDVEALAGQRAIREALLKLLPACPERDRLSKIDAEIAAHAVRAGLRKRS